MDAQESANKELALSPPKNPKEISNLELQFVYMIQDLYSPEILK
jgi:hypothetical protein